MLVGEAEGGHDYNRNCFDNCDSEDFNASLRSARCRKARGYFGAADCLRDFEIFRGASVLFPINRSQVDGKMNAA